MQIGKLKLNQSHYAKNNPMFGLNWVLIKAKEIVLTLVLICYALGNVHPRENLY